MHEFKKPMSGIRVLELGRLVAAPLAGQILGDLGADVVKVEHPDGDEYRRYGPSFVHDLQGKQTELSSGFISNNRNKRSITVDFSKEDGANVVRSLAGRADIFIENFKVGGLIKYGLGKDTLRKLYPDLIYLSVTGFGQDGPFADRPATDGAIQAMSGLQSLTGEPEGPPQRVGVLVVDMMTGIYSALAAVAALRHRDNVGRGQHIDMALLDCAMASIATQVAEYRLSGIPPHRQGNEQPGSVPAQSYRCQDGHVQLQAAFDTHFARLCACLGVPELAEDPRFADRRGRADNKAALNEILVPEFERRSTKEIFDLLASSGVICSPVSSVPTALAIPQVVARGLEMRFHTAGRPEIPHVASPLRFSEAAVTYDRPPPEIGEHTDEVLTNWLDFEPAEIAALRARNIVT